MKGLEEFCRELASPQPSPGGGTASAAAGAVAASLLSMVCGITLKSRKHEQAWPRLETLRDRADDASARLLALAEDDASAYDRMADAGRARRQSPDDAQAASRYSDAVVKATEVPMSTAEACVEVLRIADEVVVLGSKSASSDVEVAMHLASAGAKGALANVAINLPCCTDGAFVEGVRGRVEKVQLELHITKRVPGAAPT